VVRAWIAGWTVRQRVLVAVFTVFFLGGFATWLLWPSRPGEAPSPRERHYRSTTACLLTDDNGVTRDPAKAVWAGMQEASTATLIKVQQLSIIGPQTTANGLSYLNTLGAQRCTVIIAAGPAPVAAMVEGRAQFPNIVFVAVGGDTKGSAITTVDTSSPATIQANVRDIVARAA
jgi:hypothetical protein